MELMPADDNETYVKHVSMILVGWIILTLFIAIGLAVFVILT